MNGLINKIKDYEKKYLGKVSKVQRRKWDEIKTGIEGILKNNKSPYISNKIKKPLILISTPEIISLPENMGNLAQVLSTEGGGGLADISGSLVTELDKMGVNVHVALPEYKNMFRNEAVLIERDYNLMKKELNDESRIHLIEDDLFLNAKKVYGDGESKLDKIELRKANAFTRGIISRLLPELKENNKEIIVHCNDWTTGLIPPAAKNMNVMSLMTFHNIFTQKQTPVGLKKHSIDVSQFWNDLYFLEHPDKYQSFDGNFYNNNVDFMASGLHAADYINTVSPTFLKEIVNDYFKFDWIIPNSMREIIKIRYKTKTAKGILNAPSEKADPRKDPFIPNHYWFEKNGKPLMDLEEGKRENKLYFQKNTGLEQNPDIPLFFWPSRVSDPQKGFKTLNHLVPYLIDRFNMQISVVANGDINLINQFREYQSWFPGKVSYVPFSRSLSHVGKSGSDFILMPSMYEPCGIPQLEGPRYGTLPVVRRTGGLADSVEQLSSNGMFGNGFLFDDLDPAGLWHGINDAINFYNSGKEVRNNVLRRVMKESFEKFNIHRTAIEYVDVYNEILSKRGIDKKVI